MQRSSRTPTLFGSSKLAFHSLRWKPKWIPPPHFVALMNEDEDLDLVVVSTFDSLDVCCHEELLRMPINGLLRLIMDLNSRLSAAMQITDTLTKSEDQLRIDIEAVLGYKRLFPTDQETPTLISRDSGLGLLGILSAGIQAPDAEIVSFVPPRPLRQKGSDSSLRDRQKLTVSMRGKPRLADLLEEELETDNPGRSKGKSPIRRSDRQHSLIQGQCDWPGAATLPRARNLRDLQVYEGRRASLRISGTVRQQSDRSHFDAPDFGSFFRAKPKLYHSLPTRRGKSSYESSSTRNLKFRHGFRDAPSLGRKTARHTAPHNLRKPSLELFEMDRLVCNMLSVSASSVVPDHNRNIDSSLEEFGVL